MSFTIYKSSAGSGKTFTLVKEYLKLVLSEPGNFRNILAITFTNKAANEMKDRIISSLKGLSNNIPNSDVVNNLLPNLITETGLDESVISERAGKVLELILHNYSDFAISTIDSFVHKIIRTFSYDLKIPLNFDVELDANKLISQSIDLLISKVGSDEKLTQTLVEFIESKTEDDKSWHIENDLQKFALTLINEDSYKYIDKLKELTPEDFQKIRSIIIRKIKEFQKTIETVAWEAQNLILNNNIPQNAFFQGNKGIAKYFEYLTSKRFDKLIPGSYSTKTIEENKWYSGKASTDEKIAIDSIKSKFTEVFHKIQSILDEQHEQYLIYRLLSENIYPIAVLNEIEKLINEIKKQNNIVHISEFNKRIADIVLNEPVPFIYERLGEKYKNFLIDEFQDTSILQWQNLLPLVDNSLAEGNFNMIVGDGKQAIYRWRNGEVEQFAHLPKIFKKGDNILLNEREQSLISNCELRNELRKNYRSKAEIVDFNNKFFNFASKLLDEKYQLIYENSEQEFNPENKGGIVQIEFLDKKNSTIDFDELNFQKIKQIINKLQEDEIQLKDIAILCRNNKNASNIARFLVKENINVISSESLLLKSSPIVNFIIAFIKFLNTNEDAISKTEIINFLIKTKKIKTDKEIHENLQKIIIKEQTSVDSFISFLKNNNISISPKKLSKLPVYDLCEEIIRIFKLNSETNPYLQFFLDTVYEFSSKNNSNIIGFVEWWEENNKDISIIVPEEINAVRIMTIHKAKGLEFPVVIYPFANDFLKLTKNYSWTDFDDKDLPELKSVLIKTNKNLENTRYSEIYNDENKKSLLDMINLLYVVMTRPAKRLYVITSKNNGKSKSVPEIFMNFLKEIKLWDDQQSIYKFGTKSNSETSEKDKENTYNLKSFISHDWRKKILLSTKSTDTWDVEDPNKNMKWGNIVHYALSKINIYEDVDKSIKSLFFEGIIDNDEKEELSKKLNQLLSKPEIRIFFKKGLEIKNEADILLQNGKTYRPDRIIISEKKAIIIDYKTGKPEKHHIEQIKNYAKSLREIGYEGIQKFLIYIDDDIKLLEVFK